MSSKVDDKTADIPKILIDEKQGTSYRRLRFFGKVISSIIYLFFVARML